MSKEIGDFGEDLATIFLKENNYKIISRNFRTRSGEIDIIAKDEESICFVEVKYKNDEGFGGAVEMVTKPKLAKILKVAKAYLFENGLFESDWRIDVVAIDAQTKQCVLLKNVFLEGMKN